MDALSSGLSAAPEQAISIDSAALSGLLVVQEEGQATLLLPVVWGRNPTYAAAQPQLPRSGK